MPRLAYTPTVGRGKACTSSSPELWRIKPLSNHTLGEEPAWLLAARPRRRAILCWTRCWTLPVRAEGLLVQHSPIGSCHCARTDAGKARGVACAPASTLIFATRMVSATE